MGCGIDEAGRGPIIGPMVIGKVCGDPEVIKALGARDSKVLSERRREEILEKLKLYAQSIDYIIIPEATIDQYVYENKINDMEAQYISLLINDDNSYIIDCPDVNEERFTNLLIRLSGNKNVIARHKADALFPEVSAASIVAKVIREGEIQKIKKEIGDFGSGYPSDIRTINFLKDYYAKNHSLPPHVRKSWKTLDKIIKIESF